MSDATDLLGLASARVERVDRSWLMAPLQERLDGLSGELRHATSDARIARDVVHLLPGLLGGQGTRHYFVAFVNTAEERGGGGFLGNYGELTATDGRVRLTRSGPAVALDAGINQGHRTLAGPIEFLTRYGAYDPANSWRDVTYSPHFPYDANVIEQLYPQSGGAKIDGVISIDPIALAALLRFTGPINVSGYGFPLTSANAADVLLRQQYLEFQNNNGTRKNLLDEATKVAFDRLVRGNLPSPQALVKTLGPMVRQRHLMLHFPQPSEQQLVARVGADGAFPPENRGDVFMVAHQNYGNSKIDAYLRRTIRYDALVDPTTGQVTSIAQITLHNEAPATGLPSYVIGNSRGAPAGTSLMNLTIYSRMTASSIDVNGVSQPVSIGREAGLNAYAFRLDIPPRSTARLVVRLRGGLSPQSGSYQLAILPQASVQNDEVHANITEGPAKSTSSAVGSTGDIVRVALQLR
ncbi:MAG: hypothetical protein JWN46_1746 [Acidimicrobiales bacterium]|nr:hypothetical protein [Acidimicrobiales bacterium]